MKKKTYQERKARAEQEAMDWQLSFSDYNYRWQELAYFQDYFTKLAKRYGLTKVFRENGII